MTNTKEYNDAVEKIAKAINDTLLSLEIEDIVKFTTDALGIEIVSRESEPQEGDIICHPNTDYKGLGAYIARRNNKPAVYVENIKGVK